MPIFFDYNKLLKHYSTSAKRMQALSKLAEGKYIGPTIAGSSYLLNTNILFLGYPPAQLDHYIKLASKRNYLDYKLNKFSGLDLSMYPEITEKEIINNPLLELNKKILYFKQEK
jgi:hypothetical protein